MGLHETAVGRHSYNRIRVSILSILLAPSTDLPPSQDRIRTKMKEKGKGLWVRFEDVPKSYKDWLVNEVSGPILSSSLWIKPLNTQIMNDRSIPLIREYGEWAILDSARRTMAGWQKPQYCNRTLQVPENRHYLAENSAKRNPNAPRGARFPAHPSKRDQTSTPDDNKNSNDERIPVLLPGPSSTSDPAGFLNTGVDWNFRQPSSYPVQPVPNPSQLASSGFGFFPPGIPSSAMSTNYWEAPPPCECTYISPTHLRRS